MVVVPSTGLSQIKRETERGFSCCWDSVINFTNREYGVAAAAAAAAAKLPLSERVNSTKL